MLARRAQFSLPDGTECELPLLIPSFSSKGSDFYPTWVLKKPITVSTTSPDLLEFGRTPSPSVLVSAYDLHFGHFRVKNARPSHCLDWLTRTRVIFLDSGGYELAPDFDSAEPKTPKYRPRAGFGRAEYLDVLASLGKRAQRANFILSNFDWGTRGQPLAEQIRDARAIQRTHRGFLHSFIIKPWSPKGTVVDPRNLSAAQIADLGGFDVLGVTEKELGSNLLDKLRRVAQLRTALDRAGIVAPLHIWGGLDPILTPLYFFAGAQVFDGISWLRYAFIEGRAVSKECAPVLSQELGVHATRPLAQTMTMLHNRMVLERLTVSLQQWVDYEGKSFTMFHPSASEHLERAYQTMAAKIPELKEVGHGE